MQWVLVLEILIGVVAFLGACFGIWYYIRTGDGQESLRSTMVKNTAFMAMVVLLIVAGLQWLQ